MEPNVLIHKWVKIKKTPKFIKTLQDYEQESSENADSAFKQRTFSCSQVLLWLLRLRPLLLPSLMTNPAMTPPPPPLLLKTNPPPHPPQTPHPNHLTRLKAAWTPQPNQSQVQPYLPLTTPPPPPNLSQNPPPHLLEKISRLPPGLPKYRSTSPPTSVMENLTRWPCWGGRCLFSRWGNGTNLTQERPFKSL